MKRYLLLIAFFMVTIGANAQNTPATPVDTAYSVQLKTVEVRARWKNDTDRYHYNQMKFYVTTILPYVNAATKLFVDINAKVEDENISRRECRKYINTREEEMRTSFEDKVKGLNVTQGVLLVKLIARQTDMNIYKMLLEFKNPLVGVKWQLWARVNGMNLDKKYDPRQEPDLENIMEELGYPLPASYAVNSDQNR